MKVSHKRFGVSVKTLLYVVASIVTAFFIFVSLASPTQGAPDDAFAEHGKHLPWNNGEVYKLTSGYNEHYHYASSPTLRYLIDFARREINWETGVVSWASSANQPVRAIGDGVVVEAVYDGYNAGLGRYVKLSHGNGFETRYDHLGVVEVNVGDTIVRGRRLGISADSGFSLGSHIQISLWKNGEMVPFETDKDVEGSDVFTGEKPLVNFFDKSQHILLSENEANIPGFPEIGLIDTIGCTTSKVTWSNVAFEEGFTVHRDGIQLSPSVSKNVTEFFDTGLTPNTTYTYVVKAHNGSVQGTSASQPKDYTTPDCAGFPAAPVPPVLTSVISPTCLSVALTWNEVPGVNGYNIYRTDQAVGHTDNANITSFTDTQFVPLFEDVSYNYFVKAHNAGGESDASNVIPVTVAACSVPEVDEPLDPALNGEQTEEITFGNPFIGGSLDDPVNAYTGNFFANYTDLTVNSIGFPVQVSRAYNSRDKRIGAFGIGWQFEYDTKAIFTGEGRFAIKLPSGAADYFDQFQDPETLEFYFEPVYPRTVATLALDGDDLVYEEPSGMQYRFDAYGKLKEIRDRNQNAMVFSYDADAFLETMTDTAGRTYQFDWEDGRMTTVTDPAGRTATYTYNDDFQLESASSPGGKTWNYTYDDDQNLTLVTDPRGGTMQLTYDDEDRVIQLDHADGGSVQLDYQVGQTVQIDERGGIITVVHDSEGRMIEMVDQLSQTETYTYDAHDHMASHTDRNGQLTQMTYDAQGNLTSMNTPSGSNKTIVYGPFSRPVTVTDETGTMAMTYDSQGNLLTQTDQEGNTVEHTYDSKGLVKSSTNGEGNTLNFTYDGQGNLAQMTNPAGATTQYEYDGISRRTQSTDASNRSAEFTYNADSELIQSTNPTGDDFEYGYDQNGNLTSLTNEAGHSSTFTYTPENNLATRTDYEGNTWEFEYNQDQLLTKEKDPRGFETRHEYDASARRTKTILPEGGEMLYEYDGRDNVIKITDPNGNETKFEYTPTNALNKTINPFGDTMQWQRDELDRVTQVTDWNGNTRHTVYDGLSRVIEETTSLGGTATYQHDDAGNLIQVTDPKGGTTKYTYNDLNQRVDMTDAKGHKTFYTYDNVGNMTSITDANGNFTEFTYDERDNNTAIKNGEGDITQYIYDSRNLITEILDANGHSQEFTHDRNGRMLTRKNGKGNVFTFEYDSVGNLVKTIDEAGAINQFAYDGENRLVSQVSALGHITQFEYDAAGNQVEITDPKGNATTRVYDALNRLAESEDPLGGTSTFEYDANGNVIAHTDENGNETRFTYNPHNQKASVTNALGDTATFAHDILGNLKSQTDFRGNGTTFEYDALNRLIEKTDPLGNTSQFQHDPVGNILEHIDALGVSTQYQYDKANRLTQVNYPENVVEQIGYDSVGNIIERIDGEGGVTQFDYDANDQLIQTLSPLGFSTRFEYSPVKLREKVRDANGHETLFDYDLDRNLIETIDPRGNASNLFYDPNDNLTQVNDRRGFDTFYTYDALNRRTSWVDQESFDEVYQYDPVGNLTQKTNRRGFSTSYAYDALNRRIGTTDAKGNSEAYTYDADSNVLTRTDRDSNTTTHTYDAMSNRVTMVDALSGNNTFEYDDVYQLVEKSNANNQVTQFQYDDLRRLSKQIDALGGENRFTYNKRSERVEHRNPRGFDTVMTYDADGRMTKRTDPMGFEESFSLDPVGNMLTQTDKRGFDTLFTYNSNDQVITITDALSFVEEFTYDENGNVTNKKDARGNNWASAYTPRNNLTTYAMPEGQTEQYAYDANENLITKTLAKGNATQFTYDELDLLVGETDPLNHSTTHAYDSVERRVNTTDANSHSTQYAYDPLYRLTQITDALSGVTQHTYDPIGNLLATTDANGHMTHFEYDDLNRLTKEQNALSSVWEYDYDPNGNLTFRRDANGEQTNYVLDPNDRLTDMLYPDSAINVARAYDPNANLIGLEDESGSSSFTYDPLNRLIDQTDAQSNHMGFGYDGNDNRTQVEYPNTKTVDYTYSPNNWLSTSTDWQGLTTGFGYDDNHNLITEVYPNDSQVGYEYDSDDRLTQKINTAREEAFETYNYTYDPVHNLIQEDRAYNTLRERGPVEADHNTVDYAYDDLNRLVGTHDALGKTATYAYDAVGNRTEQTNNRNFYLIDNGKGTFDSNTSETITYNYNSLNSLTSDSLFNYEYDNNGNRLGKARKDGVEAFAYDYDTENRLRAVTVEQGNKETSIDYLYDGLNRRVQKDNRKNSKSASKTSGFLVASATPFLVAARGQENHPDHPENESHPDHPNNGNDGDNARRGNSNPGSSGYIKPQGPTWYVYDQLGMNPMAEMQFPNKEVQLRRAHGRLLSSEIFSPDAPEASDELQELGRYNYYYSNHRNDITSALKHDGQSLHNTNYEEFGNFYDVNNKPSDSSNFTDPHGHYTFSSKEWDEESRLNYFGARYYDAWSGTWTGQDTLRGDLTQPSSLHRYGFVQNNPLRYLDAFGFDSCNVGFEVNACYTQEGWEDIVQEQFGIDFYEPQWYEQPAAKDNYFNIDYITDGNGNLTDIDFQGGTSYADNLLQCTNSTQGTHGQAYDINVQIANGCGTMSGSVITQSNGKITQQACVFNGDKSLLERMGVRSVNEFCAQKNQIVLNNLKESTLKVKMERTQREQELAMLLGKVNMPEQPLNVFAQIEQDVLDSMGIKDRSEMSLWEIYTFGQLVQARTDMMMSNNIVDAVCADINCTTIAIGVKDVIVGGIQAPFGVIEVFAGGVLIGTVVPVDVAAGSVLVVVGSNNTVDGVTTFGSGLSSIYVGLFQDGEPVDFSFNPVHEGIDVITDEGSKANTALHYTYGAVDIVTGVGAVKVIDGLKSAVLNPKWKNWDSYMQNKGWSLGEIETTMVNGERSIHNGVNNLNPGNSMSIIKNPETGKSLIIDDVTKEIIQLGKEGYKY